MAKLYVDLISQPSRAVAVFAKAAAIPLTLQTTRLAKGENQTPAFAKLNPVKQVPVLQEEDGWTLSESHAIMKYLCATRLDESQLWYPAETRTRARVDATLDMHHTRVRRGASTFAFGIVMGPLGNLPSPGDEIIAWHGKYAAGAIRDLDRLMVAYGTPYVAGTSQMTIADISVACELQQLEAVPGAMDKLCAGTQAVLPWMERVKTELSPHWDEVGALLVKVRQLAEARGMRA